MTKHLIFVYGTLRRGSASSMPATFPDARFVGEAKLRGSLYDLGDYPGLLVDESKSLVTGEVFEVDDETLSKLDEFEAPSHYLRKQVEISLGTGRKMCWTYQPDPECYSFDRLIASGDWLEYAKTKTDPIMTQAPDTITFIAAVPQFAVSDLVQTVEYYRRVLGFQIAGYWDGEGVNPVGNSDSVFAIVWRGQVQLFFNRADQPNALSTEAKDAPDVYLRVIGVDALAEQLRASGAEIIDGPEDRVYGQRELVVKDCNGLILCFGEDTSGRET